MGGADSAASINRRQLILAGAAGMSLAATGSWVSVAEAAEPPTSVPTQNQGVLEASIRDLSAALAAGSTSSRELVRLYLERIESVDRQGPELRALLEVNREAHAQAETFDAERAAGRLRGPLHGIPILLKDNISTADSMETTAGSLALLGTRPPRDAAIVARLRSAGAVLLGKTNLSEWANFRSSHSSSGWSGRGGQCRNPHALDRTPSGSSSGSAVAVAADLCAVAVGTETDGSIV